MAALAAGCGADNTLNDPAPRLDAIALENLPASAQTQVLAILASQVTGSMQIGEGPDAVDVLRRLNEETDAQLAKVLSPVDLASYRATLLRSQGQQQTSLLATSLPACTSASSYLSAAHSAGQQALPLAQNEYNINTAQNPIDGYPQEDLNGTTSLINATAAALTLNLGLCVQATGASQDAALALSDANYALAGESFVVNYCPAYGNDCIDAYNASQYNQNAANNLNVALSILSNCTCTPPPPTFTASPTTVQIPYPSTTGPTTISWNAPYHAQVTVTVSMDHATATTFAGGGTTGNAMAPWIQAGHSYLFRLYDSSDLSVSLASVTVTGTALPRPTITANPTNVMIPYLQNTGSTTLSWNAPGYSAVSVYVSTDGAAATLMSSTGTSGSATPNWIAVGHRYQFKLYPTGNTTTLLASVSVSGYQILPTLTASSNPVTIPWGQTTTSYTLSWDAPGYTQVDLYGEQNLSSPGQTIFLGTIPSTGSASEPISVGENATLWMYPHGNTTTPLATLYITGVQGAPPTLTASSNPVIIPAGATTTQYTLSWNAPGFGTVDIYGEQNLSSPGQVLFLGTVDETGSASEPISVGEVATLWLYAHGDTTTPLAILNITGQH